MDSEEEIKIFGLRDLESLGRININKAFINFNIKNLVHQYDNLNLLHNKEQIQTLPKEYGRNPSISEIIV